MAFAILARVASHMFPRPGADAALVSRAWHMARVRVQAHREDDERERLDFERRRKQQAIADRIMLGYSRARGRKLTAAELGDMPRVVVH